MVEEYRILLRVRMTPLLTQTFTGNGEFAQYLLKFEPKNPPYYACAPDDVQDILHILKKCPIFLKELVETEAVVRDRIGRQNILNFLHAKYNNKIFLTIC
ncbi:hypothetical protein EVAR_71423_1 [Eumeta japonica]|uniref:Uncharacterized protein n=1 Tax=Eumeta variegata TaxID=151549 RepID=A0A4C2ACX0_EUMVA|nr:hypothetical protein EVAR_71423_1 [Eumeta japonica]